MLKNLNYNGWVYIIPFRPCNLITSQRIVPKDVSCETFVLDNNEVIDDEVPRNSEKNAPIKQRNDLNPGFFPFVAGELRLGKGLGFVPSTFSSPPKSKY